MKFETIRDSVEVAVDSEAATIARRDALLALANDLESRANHISEAIKWVRADRLDVADYLRAVRHGLKLGALAARGRL